jgi:CheY-like chemotaxis protein
VDTAWEKLRERSFDCIVLHEQSFPMNPATLAGIVESWPQVGPLPLVLYRSGNEGPQGHDWNPYKDCFLLREASSLPRLLDLSSALLHRSIHQMRAEKRHALEELHELDRPLANRKALIVDDDMRNIFALATVLEEHGMLHARAENGRDAIHLIKTDPTIDIVLMDIMMPEMDGMQTMQEIRKLPAGRDLPMIAVTAKAMKGDREKCIEAGAWDYLSKPVNTTDLLTVLRAWLHR